MQRHFLGHAASGESCRRRWTGAGGNTGGASAAPAEHDGRTSATLPPRAASSLSATNPDRKRQAASGGNVPNI